MKFGVRKLESWGYQTVKDASFLRFDTIPARDGQTDGRTDTLRSLLPALAGNRADVSRVKIKNVVIFCDQ